MSAKRRWMPRSFALAFLAALNPKLLSVDLLLMENQRPGLTFGSILRAGGCPAIF